MTTRILVTGATGFVGGAFLRRHGETPGLVLRGLGRRPSDMPGHIQADLTCPLTLDWQPDIVIHAAARSSPWGRDAAFWKQNVLATRHVVDYCHRAGVPRLVYVSSSSVFYREEDQFDLTETSPIGPAFVNAYARTKWLGECEAARFQGSLLIMRPRAVFGPGDTVLFPRLLRAAQAGRMVRLTRPGLPAQGDLIYIDTLLDYLLKGALDPSITGEVNVTNHQPVVIQDLLDQVFAALGLPPVTRTMPASRALRLAGFVETFHRICLPWIEPPMTRFGVGVLATSKTFDPTRCRTLLGPPSVSLETGLSHFIDSVRRCG